MKKIIYFTHKLFLTFSLLILVSCEGFFQMLVSTPQCIAAIDYGDIVSVKVNLKVNPNEYGEGAYTPVDRFCQDTANNIEGYQVTYLDTGVDYTSTNNPLTIKAFGYGDFCSKSFESGYEVADNADCSDVDCSTDSTNKCCTLTIQEEGEECQTSALMLDPRIQGAQPIFSDNELICAEIAESNTSFEFDDTDEFLVLVPKLCIPGPNDGGSCNSSGEYMDKQASGKWVDCNDCKHGASEGSCDDCSCAIIKNTCDTSSGAFEDENGMCVCDGSAGCEVKFNETLVYSPNQIDFADSSFSFDTTTSFTIADSISDGVCSKFEYMVMNAYHNIKNANDANADANWTEAQMQKIALNSVQAGFIVDSADNNQQVTNENYYQQIYATRYDGSKTKEIFLSYCDSIATCSLDTYTFSASGNSGSWGSGETSTHSSSTTTTCQGTDSDQAYQEFVESCSNKRYYYDQ